MKDINLTELLNTVKTIAVVGASNDESKYGYKVYKMYVGRGGCTVYPVNPNADKVQGAKSYSRLRDLLVVPDLVSVVTPPEVSEKILDEAIALGVKNIWFQPGAESDQILLKSKGRKDINIITNQCVLKV